MKINKSFTALPLLMICCTELLALEIPQGEAIYNLQSIPDSMEGIAKASAYPTATDITYLPVNVFSHIELEGPAYSNDLITLENGLTASLSIVPTNNRNAFGEYVAEVCYPEPIPANASLLIDSAGSYQVRPIDIPGYRSDRMCMYAPYMNGYYANGEQIIISRFMVIIE